MMTNQVIVTLPDETYRRAQNLAHMTGRNIADVLADTIQISLNPLGTQALAPVSELTDTEVLAVAASQMSPEQDKRLSQLLHNQQAGLLIDPEHAELAALMQVYQEGLLRKAQALNEAVKRGLRERLER